jgi:phosphoglycolate phosphatase-like HAD superfamily hydrolase
MHALHAEGYRLSIVSYAYEPRIIESLRAAGIDERMVPAERVLTMDDFAPGTDLARSMRRALVPKSRMLDELRRRVGIADDRRHTVMLVDDNPENVVDATAHGYRAFEVPVCADGDGACRTDAACPGIAGLL